MTRVIVFAIDGCTYDVVKRVAPESKFFSRLLDKTTHGYMETVPPATTAIDWVAFYTGKNPGKTGNFTVNRKDCMLDSFARGINGVHSDALWDILGREDMYTLSFNLPITYPAKEIDGVMISSFDSLGDDWCQPRGLTTAVSDVWNPVEKTYLDFTNTNEYFYYLLERIDVEESIMQTLMKSVKWDLAIFALLEADRIQHMCLNNNDLMINMILERVYKRIGIACQRIWDKYPDASVFVTCDHGMRKTDRGFFMNTWLYRHGYLDVKKTAHPLFDKYAGALAHVEDINFLHTAAWTPGLGTVAINNKNLRVEAKDAKEFREQLIGQFKTIVEPETGELVFEKVLRREEAWSGEYLKLMPDIISLPNKDAECEAHWTQVNSHPFAYNKGRGEHDLYSGFYATTAGSPGEAGAHILNMAPSILKALGIKIPSDFDKDPI